MPVVVDGSLVERESVAAPRTAPAYSDCTRVVEKEDGLNISELSFGTIGVTVGLSMLLYGFGAFFNYLPGQSGSAPLLIYGFIISLLGSALKYAQLDPLDCRTYEDADKLRASQATDIQVQVKSDTTRYRYGDEQHLEEALDVRVDRALDLGDAQRRYEQHVQAQQKA